MQAARLQIDTVKWLAAKLLPERFGDKVTTPITGSDRRDLIPDPAAVDARILELLRKAGLSEEQARRAMDDARMLTDTDAAELARLLVRLGRHEARTPPGGPGGGLGEVPGNAGCRIWRGRSRGGGGGVCETGSPVKKVTNGCTGAILAFRD